MKRLQWWYRIVGAFYLLLTAMNIYGLFFNDQLFRDTLPYPAEDLVVKAFTDAWMVFIAELGVTGAMLLYASREAWQNRILVWVVVWFEVFRGVVCDAIWITRGYDAASYLVFIGIHLAIIVTGVWLVRAAGRQKE